MLPLGVSPIIPLADARQTPKAGAKAVGLSRLVAAGFSVPDAFVISSDCYHAHLHASGVRGAVAGSVDTERRERIRSALLSTEIPQDVRECIDSAYERLSSQFGADDLKVVVRPSALEGGAGGKLDFPGAYETYVNVSGAGALQAAVRRVWASLWSGKAAAYRARYDVQSEPAMAVIVQRMLEPEAFGAAATANTVTGDPGRVVVSSWKSDDPADLRHHEFDLRDAVAGTAEEPAIALAAEQAILVEDALGERVEVEWALEGGTLWLLQARELRDLPEFFPCDQVGGCDDHVVWRRLTPQPIPAFARGLLPDARTGEVPAFPARSGRCSVSLLNGRVYLRRTTAEEPAHGRQLSAFRAREIAAGAGMLEVWGKQVAPDLDRRARAILSTRLADAGQTALRDALAGAVGLARSSAAWLVGMRYPCVRFPQLLCEFLRSTSALCDADSTFELLMTGLPDPTVLRDATLHDLGERLAAAEAVGRVDDEDWRGSYLRDVSDLARTYGCGFRDESEAFDISSWRSWLEDPDPIFRMVAAAACRCSGPTIVTRHAAAAELAAGAAAGVRALLRGGARKRFDSLLHLAREFPGKHSEAEHLHALTCTALRTVLAESAERLVRAGLLVDKGDVFHLTPEELLSAEPKQAGVSRPDLAVLIADRKHQHWLDKRFSAPSSIPVREAGNDNSRGPDSSGGRRFEGHTVVPGLCSGRARVARTAAEAGELLPGEILVVESPSLFWTPFAVAAGGFVAEGEADCPSVPSMLHAYGIPSLVGCAGVVGAIEAPRAAALNADDGFLHLRGRPGF